MQGSTRNKGQLLDERSKAAHLAELTSNLAIFGLTVSVIFDCDPKSLNSL
jgi:hypothetical protein